MQRGVESFRQLCILNMAPGHLASLCHSTTFLFGVHSLYAFLAVLGFRLADVTLTLNCTVISLLFSHLCWQSEVVWRHPYHFPWSVSWAGCCGSLLSMPLSSPLPLFPTIQRGLWGLQWVCRNVYRLVNEGRFLRMPSPLHCSVSMDVYTTCCLSCGCDVGVWVWCFFHSPHLVFGFGEMWF